MKIPVVVSTTPACQMCNATLRRMDKLGIIYDKVDLTQHPGLADKFSSADCCNGSQNVVRLSD